MPSVKAPWGQRTIQFRVYFWTDDIAPEGQGSIEPKQAWTCGTVDAKANRAHGIDAMPNPIPFNSMAELPVATDTAIEQVGVNLRQPGRRRRG